MTAICFTCFLIRCIVVSFKIEPQKMKIFIFSYYISYADECFKCFPCKLQVAVSAFDMDLTLDVLDHPVLNLIYYMVTNYTFVNYLSINLFLCIFINWKEKNKWQVVEVLPSALVLFILRKLPPKRVSAQYHPIQ